MRTVGLDLAGSKWRVADAEQLRRCLCNGSGTNGKALPASTVAVVAKLRAVAQAHVPKDAAVDELPRASVRDAMAERLAKSTPLDDSKADAYVAAVASFLEKAQTAATGLDSDGRPAMPARLTANVTQTVDPADITADQRRVLDVAALGYNLFVGGRAGTGKTVMLQALYRELSEVQGLRVGLTAMTGVAGVHVGGVTFHRGVGVPVTGGAKWDSKALRAIDVLVVDEVSLLSDGLLQALDGHARLARRSDEPFGGLQVVLCGDFMQLAPDGGNAEPCFSSPLLKHFVLAELVTALRHRFDDHTFRVLSALRVGRMPEELEALVVPDAGHLPEHLDNAVRIFPRRRDAIEHNARRLDAIDSPLVTYTPMHGDCYTAGRFTPACVATFPPDSPGATVKISALQPALTESLSGAHGAALDPNLVIAFAGKNAYSGERRVVMRVRHESDLRDTIEEGTFKAVVGDAVKRLGGSCVYEAGNVAPLMPLVIASQLAEGADPYTVEPVGVKLGCRVMVNRNLSASVVNGTCGTVVDFAPADPGMFPDPWAGRAAMARMTEAQRKQPLPVIELPDGRRVQIPPMATRIGGTAATHFFARDVFTIPLQLGYAFTVHKVQGLTLNEDVVFDCTNMFNCPHLVYVACSRVRSLTQLSVVGLKKKHVAVHPRCLEFVSTLSPADRELPIPDTARPAAWARAARDSQVSETAEAA